jgi:hypothetical protein
MNGQDVPQHPSLLEADSVEGPVERVYQQMFAVLALEKNGMVADLGPHRQEWLLWRWASSLDWYGVDDLVRERAKWPCNLDWSWNHADKRHRDPCRRWPLPPAGRRKARLR